MTYRFDDFHLDPATRELRSGGALVALPARAFDCLAYLIEHRDRAVGRDELIAAVWGRTEISEALLNHTVVRIRRSLGDTGNEQRTIRTVPRFGYRWIGEIAATPAPPESAAPAPPAADAAMPVMLAASPAIETPVAPPRRFPRFVAIAMAGLAVITMGVATVVHRSALTAASVGLSPGAKSEQGGEALVAPALVLPAEVTAPDDWRWLRFGLMDLVANRLRDGALHTMPSESVVGLLKQRDAAAGDDLLHDTRLAKVAALRVLPRVRVEGNRWNVRLDAWGAQRTLSVEAQADDAIKAGREAADLLLRKLGHTPNVVSAEPLSPALEELLQRSGAAMLADQLDQARDLITRAPPDLQQQPRVEQRMAQIELRTGDYRAVETRLHILLDRLSPQRDAALRARASITLAVAYLRQNQLDKANELYDEAISLRRGQSDSEVLGIAYLGRAAVLAEKSRFDEATSELSRARIELETVGDGLGVAAVDVNSGEFLLMRHRPADALPVLKAAVREFEQVGAREGLAHTLAQQAIAEREMLDFGAALTTTERFWPPESHTNNLRLRWTLTCVRAEALADLGRYSEAQALIERIRTDSDPRSDLVTRALAGALAARIAFRRGEADIAAQRSTDALVPGLRDADAASYTKALLLRTRALRQGGHAEEAAAATRGLRAWVDSASDDWRGMYATLAEAEQSWAAGRHEVALEQFAVAMRSAEHFNVPEDLVAIATPYLAALVRASQLNAARVVAGRIAPWADRDLRAAGAQIALHRALGNEDAARKAEEGARRISPEQPPPGLDESP
ncbi:hypothetical protein GCM10009105_36810 [Dokdonella soli]|uniref:OmpR/PhoB-type domain-containing protein n=1 Tax=Dokdonella soli TaxID=529810 RepID=A0ABN1IZA0_9GAMM